MSNAADKSMDEERGLASLHHHQQVVCDPHQSCFSAVGGGENQTETFRKGRCVSGDPVGMQKLLFVVPWREIEGWKWACSWQGFQGPRRVF